MNSIQKGKIVLKVDPSASDAEWLYYKPDATTASYRIMNCGEPRRFVVAYAISSREWSEHLQGFKTRSAAESFILTLALAAARKKRVRALLRSQGL
jgi:hypothetical protein